MRRDEPVGANRSLPELFRRLVMDIVSLTRAEIDLARVELSDSIKPATAAGGFFGATAVVALGTVTALTAFIAAALALGMPLWGALLIVTVGYAGSAAFAAYRGKGVLQSTFAPPVVQSNRHAAASHEMKRDTNVKASGGSDVPFGDGKPKPINFELLKATLAAFSEDKAPRLAAAIAYSAIFSIAPLFIVLIAILGWVIGVQNGGHGHHVAEDMLVGQVRNSAGAGTADTVRQMIAASFNKPRQSVIAQIIGWVTFLIGATALFGALQDALNAVWHVEATKGGFKQMLRDRLASFGMILIVGLLLLVSLVANIAISFVGSHLLAQVPVIGHPAVLAAIGQLITLCVVTLIFAAIFKVLPDVKITWRDVAFGAVATAVLFVAGEAAIALYFRYAGVASAYGAAGSLLVAILWIYYSAMLLLLGAEFTKVHAGKVETVAPTAIRSLTDHPAGIDPRAAARST